MATMHTLRRGDLAFYETTRSGMVPVKVLSISRDGDELVARVKVTADRYAYGRGDVLHVRAGAFLHSRRAVRASRVVTGQTVHVPDSEVKG